MARIRSIKPDYFRHEALQDLEIDHPGVYPMMVFAGLWGHCDNKGRFEWRPRQLKLDILPFLPFDMAETLAILERAGMVKHYTVDGKDYGEVPTFLKHQRITGKEATEGEKHPDPSGETTGKQSGNTRDHPDAQEGKGREGKGKEEGNGVGGKFPPDAPDPPPKKSVSKATKLPEGFTPNETGTAYAEQKSVKIAVELESFKNWHLAKGSTMKDWQAAWRTWCDKAVEFGRTGGTNGKNGSSRADSLKHTIDVLTGRSRETSPVIDGTANRVD